MNGFMFSVAFVCMFVAAGAMAFSFGAGAGIASFAFMLFLLIIIGFAVDQLRRAINRT